MPVPDIGFEKSPHLEHIPELVVGISNVFVEVAVGEVTKSRNKAIGWLSGFVMECFILAKKCECEGSTGSLEGRRKEPGLDELVNRRASTIALAELEAGAMDAVGINNDERMIQAVRKYIWAWETIVTELDERTSL